MRIFFLNGFTSLQMRKCIVGQEMAVVVVVVVDLGYSRNFLTSCVRRYFCPKCLFPFKFKMYLMHHWHFLFIFFISYEAKNCNAETSSNIFEFPLSNKFKNKKLLCRSTKNLMSCNICVTFALSRI